MDKRRSGLAGGVLLILLGLFFLAIQFLPGLRDLIRLEFTWPLIIVAVGLIILVVGLAVNVPAMAIPACIVGGIGALLWWQNLTGNWQSWSYVWTLIPGFVGAGIVLSALLGGEEKVSDGLQTMLVSLVMFGIFGSFFGALGLAGQYWPLLLVLLGVILLARGLFGRR